MRTSSRSDLHDRRGRTALLWDESFLWGVMAYKALDACGLTCDLIRSEDVRRGKLTDYSLLFVPGGWASNKIKALGNNGIEEIKRFVREGGAYLGFCGGAGLATMDGIGLVPVKRRPTKDRVPSFSGRIGLKITSHHMWEGLVGNCGMRNAECGVKNSEPQTQNSQPVFHAWWPSQFVIDGQVTVLASYGEALPDAFSSDVNVGDAVSVKKWPELERLYQINLDPNRLQGEPAVIESSFGRGKVILSLIHFDTPGDTNGETVLKNVWKHLVPDGDWGMLRVEPFKGRLPSELVEIEPKDAALGTPETELISEIEAATASVIALGCRNFLWFWRNPMLLQWRRGVRGLEYCTLSVTLKELVRAIRDGATSCSASDMGRIRDLLLPFADKAKRLLLMERYAMQNGHITYEKCDDPEIQSMREELFSRSKSYGGLFKKLIDEIDGSLFRVLTETGTGHDAL